MGKDEEFYKVDPRSQKLNCHVNYNDCVVDDFGTMSWVSFLLTGVFLLTSASGDPVIWKAPHNGRIVRYSLRLFICGFLTLFDIPGRS